jgi:putative ABC transport system ATP-binding protein
MGYIFQSFNLIPYLSVLDNITLPLQLSPERKNKISKKTEKEAALWLCEKLGISNLVTKKVTELSVGQQQRVAVARALLGGPEIILADEPTSSLDFDHREKFIKLLFEVSNLAKSTVLFVSHDKTLQPLFDRAVSLPTINTAANPDLDGLA